MKRVLSTFVTNFFVAVVLNHFFTSPFANIFHQMNVLFFLSVIVFVAIAIADKHNLFTKLPNISISMIVFGLTVATLNMLLTITTDKNLLIVILYAIPMFVVIEIARRKHSKLLAIENNRGRTLQNQ
jgi:uncharacterized RDD family membrane protein YckC